MDRNGYDKDGYYCDTGFNNFGIHKETGTEYNSHGYDIYGFDEDGYSSGGYDSEGYDDNGRDSEGYNKDGYDDNGRDSEGKTREDNMIDKEKEKEYTDNCVSQTFEQEAETGFDDDD